jgi:hypothetical protein
MSVTYKTTSWKHYTVKSVNDDGGAVLELVLDRARLWVNDGGRTIEFDSGKVGTAPQEFAAFVSNIGRPRDVTVTAVGDIRFSDLPKDLDKQAKFDALLKASAEVLDDQNLNILVILPEQPVTVGDSWQENFEVNVLMEDSPLRRPVRLQRVYTLTELAGDVATIDLQTVILTPVSDPTQEAQLLQRTPHGVIRFDVEQGRIVSRETRFNNEAVNFQGPGSRVKIVRNVSESVTQDDEQAPVSVSDAGSAM